MNTTINVAKPTLAFISICFLITACSVDVTKNLPGNGANSQSLSYNLTENGCSTGNQSFSTQDALCNGLRDDALNNYCAQSLRFQKFQNDCPGHTW
jgi:hypothetical protein